MASALRPRRGDAPLITLVRALVGGTGPCGPRRPAPATADPVQVGRHCQERAADVARKPKNGALASGFDRRARTVVRAALSYHNDEGATRCLPGRAGTTARPSAATP